jgi:RND family efflux transporter MFP subunit
VNLNDAKAMKTTTNDWKGKLAAGLALLGLLAGLASCRPNPGAAGGPPPMGPVPVTIEPADERELTDWTELNGRVEAVESVELRPRVSGALTEVAFQAGELVKQGDVLFRIDERPYQAKLEQAEAEHQRAEAAAASAKREFSRAAELLKAKAISPEQAETRESQHLQAQAALAAAHAAVKASQLDVEFCRVTAPVSGRVGRALITVGNVVSGMPGAASLLTTIVSVDPVHVYADIDENTLLRMKGSGRAGQNGTEIPVELQLSGEEGYPHKGKVESFDNRLDAGTGSMVLRAVFPDPEAALTPGLFARLRLPVTGTWKAVTTPDSAIQTDLARKFVYVVDEAGLAQYRPVELGDVFAGRRVIRSGLKAGEKVVVRGHAKIFMPGMPVQHVAAEAAAVTKP